jgi:hypothetical protein
VFVASFAWVHLKPLQAGGLCKHLLEVVMTCDALC